MTSVQKKQNDYLNLKEEAEKRVKWGEEGGVLGGARGRR